MNNLQIINQGLLTYWLFYLLFLSILLIPGYSLIYFFLKLKKIYIESNLQFVLAIIVSIITMFTFGIIFLFTKSKLILDIFSFFCIFLFLYFLKARIYRDMFTLKKYFFIIFLALFTIFVTIAQRDYVYNLSVIGSKLDNLVPVPITGYIGYDADSITPWRIARYYYSRQPLNSMYAKKMLHGILIYERTPLLPIITTIIIHIFGESHFVYQRFLEILGVLYFLSIYYLVDTFVMSTKSSLIYLLLLINVQLSLMSYNVELFYKYFASFPLIIATALLSKQPSNRLLQVQLFLLTLSFLIHPYTIIISITFLIFYIVKIKSQRQLMFNLFKWSLPLFILLGIWFYADKIITLPDYFNRTTNLYSQNNSLNKSNFISTKIVNLVQLFIPNPYQQSIDPNSPLTSIQSRFQFLRYSLISNLTPIIFVFLSIFIIRFRKKAKEMLFMGLGPLIMFWLIYLNNYNQRFDYGGTYFLLYHFSVPLLLTYVFANLKTKFSLMLVTLNYIIWMVGVLLTIGDPFLVSITSGTTAYFLAVTQIILFVIIGVITIFISINVKTDKMELNNTAYI